MSKAEKYISDSTNEGYYIPWLTPEKARKAVEIAREEMMERVCEYLDGFIEFLNDHRHGLNKERIIEGLKQAMKDE